MADFVKGSLDYLWQFVPPKKEIQDISAVTVQTVYEMFPDKGRIFVRIAGLSGFLAVVLGAYGSHVFNHEGQDPKLKLVYETGNRYHFIHTLALLAVPLTRRPQLVGGLLCAGIVCFSGSCYMHALSGNLAVRKVTPYGGLLLMAGWFAMFL